MMTVSTLRRSSRALEVSIKYNDSGVVMRMSGGRRFICSRSRCGVSPLRTPTASGWYVAPRRSAVAAMPVSGERRLRSTSTPSALIGEIYTTRQRSASAGTGANIRRLMALRKAARVLPEPVGASNKAEAPLAIGGQPSTWAGVGPRSWR
jgi:hypothetical protein